MGAGSASGSPSRAGDRDQCSEFMEFGAAGYFAAKLWVLTPARLRLVVNRWHRADEEPLQAFEKRVKLPIFERLPNDFKQVSRAVNMGTELPGKTINWCKNFAAWPSRLPVSTGRAPRNEVLSSGYFQASSKKRE